MVANESQVESIFTDALQQGSPEQLAAFLDQACGDDEPLRHRVQQMLHAQSKLGSFLQTPALASVAALEEPLAEGPGTQIGPYKLLEQIGEGGFGIVFMAEQTQPVRRKVALKLIKPGMDTRQVIARFEAERQALALMDHPNIARVLDAGATASGRPYFVMELVHGVSITEYCDQQRLTSRERLELCVSVCHAAQHAHQKGIIHRDIKPSNVLVTLHDGTPVVKVIDFGIAKAIGQQLTEKTLFTNFAHMMGTPLYMSPEQAALSGLDIDTRTDVYSLGVLIYELLTGTTPFERERLKNASYDEIRRMVREEEPPTLSARLSDLSRVGRVRASHQTADRGGTRRLVPPYPSSELDSIVMKALNKDRTRRYETANALASDLQRYLKGEPIEARPPSAAYRFSKFAQRHRLVMTSIGLVVAALVLGMAASTWQAFRAIRAERLTRESLLAEQQSREDAEDARQQSEANFRKARQAVDDMYTQVAEKWLAQQPHMEPIQREFLDKALRYYAEFAQDASSDPAVRLETVRAYRRVAEIQHRLGEPLKAEQAFLQTVDRWQKLADDFPEAPEHRQGLAQTLHRLGILLGDTGRYEEEEQAHRRALALQENLAVAFPAVPDYQRDLARGQFYLGLALTWLRRRPEAEEVYRRAIVLQEKLAVEFPAVPEHRHYLAESHCYRGKLRSVLGATESATALRRAIALYDQLAAEFPHAPQYRNGLAVAWYLLAFGSSSPEAEQPLNTALTLQRKLASDFPAVTNYRFDLFRSLLKLASLREEAGRGPEAEAAYREALSIAEKLAEESPTVHYHRGRLASVCERLGDFLRDAGRLPEAEPLYRQSIALYEQLMAESPDAATAEGYPWGLSQGYVRLGSLLAQTGRDDEALVIYRQAIELGQKVVALAPQQARSWQTLGAAQYRAGEWSAAIASLQKARELNQGADSFSGFFLAMAHCRLGQQQEAQKWHDQAVEWMEKNQPQNEELGRFRAEAAQLLNLSDPIEK